MREPLTITLPLLPPQGLSGGHPLLLPQRGGECSGVALLPGELPCHWIVVPEGPPGKGGREREYGVGGGDQGLLAQKSVFQESELT